MASDVKMLDQNDDEEITALLLGRRIVRAEMRDFREPADGWERPDGQAWGGSVEGRLTLDDGTVLLVIPNEGGCSCGAGDYHLTDLAACDNVITAVRVTAEPHPEHPDDEEACSYRIYVYAEDTKINAVQVDGDDGNGYYGTGFELIVVPA